MPDAPASYDFVPRGIDSKCAEHASSGHVRMFSFHPFITTLSATQTLECPNGPPGTECLTRATQTGFKAPRYPSASRLPGIVFVDFAFLVIGRRSRFLLLQLILQEDVRRDFLKNV